MRIAILSVALLAGGCSSIAVTGAASDGETFTGSAVGEGVVDQYGTMRLTSSRGLNCFGPWHFDGPRGPKGRATMTCSDGTIADAVLDMPSRTGTGTLGSRRLQFKW